MGDVFPVLLIQPLVGVITLLMKRELFLELGGFNEELKALEDYEFTLRVAYAHKILFVDEILAIAYETANSVGKSSDNHILTQCYIIHKYQKELEQYGLKKEKFFKVLYEAKIHNRVREFLKYVVYNFQDAEYQEYVKVALKQLAEEEEKLA
jgi:GT2 family glycosyltransferase